MYTNTYSRPKVVLAFVLWFSMVGFLIIKLAPGSKTQQSSYKDPSFGHNEIPPQFQDILAGMSASIEYSPDNGRFSCCVKIGQQSLKKLDVIWKNLQDTGIACILLYRGVEIPIGQMPGNTIQERVQQAGPFCLTIAEEHEYLLFRDPEYELFIKNLDKNVTALETQMELAGKMVQQIPTAGATQIDRKNLLGAFFRSSLSIEKPLPHVEIGSYMGFSGALTSVFADLLGFSTKSKVFMVSPSPQNDNNPGVAFNKTVERLGLHNRVTWFTGTNVEVPWSFGPAKSIYEDSGHGYAVVSQSVSLISRYLIEGGLAIFHDVPCKHYYQGLQWVFSNLRHSPGWREVVLPSKQLGGQNCKCETPKHLIDGCNYIAVLQKRVSQPPLGLRIVIQGNMVGTTFESGLDGGAVVLYNELGSFTTYMDFLNP
jgi:hypothetical protein